MHSLDHGYGQPFRAVRAADVHTGNIGEAVGQKELLDLMNSDDFRGGRTGDFQDVSQMIAMGMGDKDQIIRPEVFFLGGLGVFQPRINQDFYPLRGGYLKRGVSIEGYFHDYHLS